jgi:hypothetical protein
MDRRITFEDFFDIKNRDAGLKVSGNKKELAQSAFGPITRPI